MFKSQAIRYLATLLAVGCLGQTPLLSAQVFPSVSIPSELQGRYSLDVTAATPLSPLQPANPRVVPYDIQLYVTAIGDMCIKRSNSETVDLIASSPELRGGPFGKVHWDIPSLDLVFALDINNIAFSGFDVLSTAGSLYARLTGPGPIPDTGSCGDLPLPNVNILFSDAEQAFPALFPPSALTFNQIGNGFDVFRYYPSTEIYLAVRGDEVFARGGLYGEAFVPTGSFKDLTEVTLQQAAQQGGTPSINRLRRPDASGTYDFYRGTFALTLELPQPFSPLPSGTALTFVLSSTGQLCVGELNLAFPRISGTNAIWSNANGDIQYVLDLTRDDDPADFDENFPTGQFFMESAAGVRFGEFAGDKTSLSTECADAAGTDPDTTRINQLFGLAEAQYSSVFPSGPQTYNLRADGYTYRYYFNTQVFLAVRNGVVYLNGGQFGTNEEPVPYGSLTEVLSRLNDTTIPAIVPSSAFGTYAMIFGSATTFSPFADGTTATVVLGSGGDLCLNGVSLGAPFARQSAPSMAVWENKDTGLVFTLNLAALGASAMTLDINSASGLDFSVLAGNRTSLSTSCGTASNATNLTLANQLFSLLETHYATLFPTSVLSFNQLDGNTVRRFYPATGVTTSITGQNVSVKGGSFGSTLVEVGQLSALIAKIIADTTPVPPPPAPTPVYDLTATGTGQVRILNLAAVNRTINEKRSNLTRPLATDTAALRAIVQDVMKDEVRQFDTVTVTVTSDTATALTFSATVVSNTVSAGNSTSRTYQLVITLRQR
jgi:hypothetical protein